MNRFVDVPASAIRNRLAGAGFVLVLSGHEEVYERTHDKDSRYVVKVYSSIRTGARGVRACGADAIRVIALLVIPGGKTYPIFRASRVYRTGSVEAVLDRMLERARQAYVTCNEHRKKMANR